MVTSDEQHDIESYQWHESYDHCCAQERTEEEKEKEEQTQRSSVGHNKLTGRVICTASTRATFCVSV